MYAAVGDRLVVKNVHVGGPIRDGEILEVRGRNGRPPYRVRWSDTGHESLVYPGLDAQVEHFGAQAATHRQPGSGSATKAEQSRGAAGES